MAGFILNFESNILMLEFLVKQLYVPSVCPFDAVISSKFIVSFNFLDDEWVDVMPQRADYREYCGSIPPEENFNGGKSVVLALAATELCEKVEGLMVEVVVRRAISKYFEMDSHEWELGKLCICVDELWNHIVEELRLRRELGSCLKLAHPYDPICKSMRHEYMLRDPDTGECTDGKIQIYLRLSHLRNHVITEIEMPSYQDCNFFYAQEQCNQAESYELKEIARRDRPFMEVPMYSRVKDCAELQCHCTPEQKNAVALAVCERTMAISTSLGSLTSCSNLPRSACSRRGVEDGPVIGARNKVGVTDKGVGTGDGKTDRGTGTNIAPRGAKGKGGGDGDSKGKGMGNGDDDDDNDDDERRRKNQREGKKRRGKGPGVYIPKCVPCEPCVICCHPCEPCVPCCVPTPCLPSMC